MPAPNRIYAEAALRGWSLAEVARRAGASTAHISHMSTGYRQGTPAMRARLCAVFGLSYETLFPDSGIVSHRDTMTAEKDTKDAKGAA